jgi:hypothetical protein
VRTNLSVKARVGEEKALDGATMQQVLTDNLRNIFYVDEAVPNGLRIDDHDGAMLALVETAGFIGADLALQPCVLNGVLESSFELLAATSGTAGAAGIFVPLVGADKDMSLKLCHWYCFLSGRALICSRCAA